MYALFAELIAFQKDQKEKYVKQKQQSKPFLNKKITYEELRQNNNTQSAWIAINQKVYDITNFLNKHPGGREFLLMHSGRDSTVPFQSYHSLNIETPLQMLQNLYIGDLIDNQQPIFKADQGFYKDCVVAIKKYFQDNKLDPKDPIPGLKRAIPIWIGMFVTFYLAFIYNNFSLTLRILFSVLFGIFQALNSLHIMHDASHGAYGHSEKSWWFFGRLTLDWMSGSSMLAWHNQHVVGHHSYTNVMGKDPDLPKSDQGDVRRLLKWQKWENFYKYQKYYMPPLYGLLALRSRYYDIFEIFALETNGPIKVNPISIQDKLRQSASKAFWIFWRVFLPLKLLSLSTVILLFFIVEFVTGYWLAFNFQVSHVSTEAEYFHEEKSSLEKQEWAILQVNSSVDYSHGSGVATFLSGALNYQVVHHLFPGVSQYWYPQIAPIINNVCKKYGLKYSCLPDFYTAMKCHFQHLENMGLQGKQVELKYD